MVRISGGSAKGRIVGQKKVFSKKGEADDLRPTSAKVRQALFNILRDRIEGSSFLDLYAGTGAVGIEALSRGAEKAVFVDNNSVRVSVISELVVKFGFEDNAEVVRDDAFRFLTRTDSAFDIIFVDPPYASGQTEKVLPLLADGDCLKEGGVIVVEHFYRKSPGPSIGALSLLKTYRYGDTSLSLFSRSSKEDS